MQYFKNIEDGYLTSISTETGMEEITQEEYESILHMIRSAPAADEGWKYRLKDDLTWELAECPPEEDPDLSDDEVMDILMGVSE